MRKVQTKSKQIRRRKWLREQGNLWVINRERLKSAIGRRRQKSSRKSCCGGKKGRREFNETKVDGKIL